MISAICTPTALSCRCTWAVTNSHMRASCRRSGRTTASLFLSSWSRYGGGSFAHSSAHTSKGRQNEMIEKKRTKKEHLFIFSGYFWKAVVQNRLFLFLLIFSLNWELKFGEKMFSMSHWEKLKMSKLWYFTGFKRIADRIFTINWIMLKVYPCTLMCVDQFYVITK